MKKLKIIITGLLMIVLLSFMFVKKLENKETLPINDALKFEQEYETLNETTNGEKRYKSIDIPDDNPIIYASYEDVERIITSETGVIYFGFPECPWCRNAVPILIDAAKEVGVDKIYYFNALEIRDVKALDKDGNVITEKEGTEEYKKLLELLHDYLDDYEGLNDPTIKRLYFPTVVFIKDGKIIGSHISTVETQTDPSIALTKKEYEELKNIYSTYMLKVLGIICDVETESKC